MVQRIIKFVSDELVTAMGGSLGVPATILWRSFSGSFGSAGDGQRNVVILTDWLSATAQNAGMTPRVKQLNHVVRENISNKKNK